MSTEIRTKLPDGGAERKWEKTCWQCGETFFTDLDYCPKDGSRLVEIEIDENDDPLIGTLFDERYDIIKQLGEGGMSTVYSARQTDFDRRVAIKILKADYLRDENIRRRFMYEARIIANLQHPNAVRLFDFGQTAEGSFYMVMELLEGESLADRLACRFLTYREIFNIVPSICGVLGEAHKKDVIHRDLKPENIFLLHIEGDGGNSEFPKLLDFGIAKHLQSDRMTKSGTLWGTPAYMSPEQARGEPVGAPADVYAIGLILYELICGNLPFQASTNMGYAVKHMNEHARTLHSVPGLHSVPEEFDDLILRCLDKDIDTRPQSMEELANQLTSIRETHYHDELLDSVPAEEVDPIALQRWLTAPEDDPLESQRHTRQPPDESQESPLRSSRHKTPHLTDLGAAARTITAENDLFLDEIEIVEFPTLEESIPPSQQPFASSDISASELSTDSNQQRKVAAFFGVLIVLIGIGALVISLQDRDNAKSKAGSPQGSNVQANEAVTITDETNSEAASDTVGRAASAAASTVMRAQETALRLKFGEDAVLREKAKSVSPRRRWRAPRRRDEKSIKDKKTKDALRGTF